MANKYPYTPAKGQISSTINQFRKSFPASVTIDTLKKLGLASNNEGRVVNLLKFLGFLDQEGNRTEVALKIFSIHDDSNFQKEFGEVIKTSYSPLFDLHKEEAWVLNRDSLISFFRTTDGSTDIVGNKQADTFQILAYLSGHSEHQEKRPPTVKGHVPQPRKKKGTIHVQDDNKHIEPLIPRTISTPSIHIDIQLHLSPEAPASQIEEIFLAIEKHLYKHQSE